MKVFRPVGIITRNGIVINVILAMRYGGLCLMGKYLSGYKGVCM